MAVPDQRPSPNDSGFDELNHAILESALDCIITMDAEGIVQEWNPAAERTFGFSRAEAVGRELAELIIPPALRERHRQGLARYLETGKGPVLGKRIEIAGLHADGRELLVELAITAFHLAGEPVFTAYLRDITERDRSDRRRTAQYAVASLLAGSWKIEEAALQIIQTIAESGNWTLGSFWLFEPSDGLLRCHSVWHLPLSGLEKFASISRARVFPIGEGLPGRVAQTEKPVWIAEVKRDEEFPRAGAAAAAGLAGAFAFPLVAADRVKGVIELFSPAPVQPDEDLLQLVNSLGSQIAYFIERRQIANELQQQKEVAEAANAAKDRFLATLSHELRTPLTPVLLWAGGMSHDHALPEEVREGLRMIVRNVELEARLIDDLLDLTRISRGKLRLQLQETDAHQVLRHAIEIVREGEGSPRLAFELDLRARDHQLHADPARLQQVFWNLLRNACKFSDPEGPIVVHSENREDGFITIIVSDRGDGIPAENLEKIFNAFEQGGERREGLGLGLAISKAIVEVHGGRIHAESAGLGRGASFIVTLPTSPTARAVV
ncbi:MAG: PAS domain S-box protein [Verrucomicrobiota bacterium]|nr:PAS domain S-box protein [Verrucomicrobiota bacterium]